ncbi:ROK family protein (plasmid) [Ensifer adhaerens]|uniref:ROK family protein n=1 Tax=Ensifer adhaerens TaxID=106592 RepID=UPI0023A9D81C|nr:ROK family protein [Ensifer adhaerens]WDZ81829.1 ROK family protein [Ensifer adhaerens]
MPDQDFAIGIDIGGGSTKIGLVSAGGDIVERRRIVVGDADDADVIVDHYAEAIREIMAAQPQARPRGIGIGFPGRIHPDNLSGDLGNIPALDDFPLAERIGAQFFLPARMENDGTAAGLAEAMFGKDKDAGRLLLIAAGTGIGVALTVDGKPFITSGGGLGNAGQLIISGSEGQPCRQGCVGCLESLASGDALNSIARRYCIEVPDSAIAARARELGREADASDVIMAALDGDTAARAMLADVGRWLGRGAATWAQIFAPDVILLGGGLSAAGDLLLAPLEREARLCGLDMYLAPVRFSLASLGNDAGIIGAAAQIFLIPQA